MKLPGCYGRRRAKSILAIVGILVVVTLSVSGSAWAAGGGDGHDAEAKGWQKTDWYRVMNFAVLAIGLFLLLRKPVAQALSNRIKGIAEELKDLEGRKATVEKQLADYNDKLALLDKEAEKIIADYIQQGEEAKVRILKEAQSAAEKLKDQAHKNIEHEFKRARSELQEEIVEKALAKAEQVIKDQISDQDQDRLVNEYLDKVVA